MESAADSSVQTHRGPLLQAARNTPPPSQLHGGHSMKYSAGTLVVLRLPECVQGWESGVHSDEGVHSHGGCFLAFTPFTAELLENVIV